MSAAILGSEWAPGTALIVIRRGYRHHGIYVGHGRVIHYAGLIRHRHGRIEEVSLEEFRENKPVYVRRAPEMDRGRDIVLRARSRLGECRYDLIRNNCEHFCNWCLFGESRSAQVESLARPIRALARLAAATLAFILAVAPPGSGLRRVHS